jgi:hypothetical protein
VPDVSWPELPGITLGAVLRLRRCGILRLRLRLRGGILWLHRRILRLRLWRLLLPIGVYGRIGYHVALRRLLALFSYQ